jgi:hypothetical protein
LQIVAGHPKVGEAIQTGTLFLSDNTSTSDRGTPEMKKGTPELKSGSAVRGIRCRNNPGNQQDASGKGLSQKPRLSHPGKVFLIFGGVYLN